MQQELWLRTTSQVLLLLRLVNAMKASSSSDYTPTPANTAVKPPTSSFNDSTSRTVPRPSTSSTTTEAQPQSSGGTGYHVVDSNSTAEGLHNPPNPVKASRTHQELHKELLLAHRKGLVVCRRPELQLVLERRRRVQTEKEEGERSRSPLERVLLKRQQVNQEKEKMQEKAEDPQVLEFQKVRENLKKIQSHHLYRTPNS